MTYKDILKDIAAKKYAPIYFLQSEEPYFIDLIIDQIEQSILPEGEKSFNQVVMYGKETNFKQVMDQARQFPMMSQYRVVIVKEAQNMSSLESLLPYFETPAETTILAIAHKHKKLDKRKKKLWTALKKNATILDAPRIYDDKVPGLIQQMAREKKLTIPDEIAYSIAENLGNDLSKIANEIEKLTLNLAPSSVVTKEQVETYVGISKDHNVFELQKAIGHRNKVKAYKIVTYFSKNSKSHPIQMNIGALYNYFSKLFVAKKFGSADNRTLASKLKVNPFFVAEYKRAAHNFTLEQVHRALKAIHIMDKRCKGVGSRRSDDLGIYQEFLQAVFN